MPLVPPSVRAGMRDPRLGRSYGACAMLALAHAVLGTLALLGVASVRSFHCCQTFASGVEWPWIYATAVWPLWWIPATVFAFRGTGRSLKPWVAATVAWLPSAAFVCFVWWAIRNLGR